MSQKTFSPTDTGGANESLIAAAARLWPTIFRIYVYRAACLSHTHGFAVNTSRVSPQRPAPENRNQNKNISRKGAKHVLSDVKRAAKEKQFVISTKLRVNSGRNLFLDPSHMLGMRFLGL
jgi:hypothetical protein